MSDSCSADLTNYNSVKPEEEVTKVKPRITLRIKPPLESKLMPKITLRLGSQKSVHQATKRVNLRVDGRKRRCLCGGTRGVKCLVSKGQVQHC